MHEKANFIKCNEEQEKKIQTIREAMSLVYKLFDDTLVDSRETSLAYTKLEEAQFWAIKGISHNKEK
jgi:hypothetical protein